jgi:kynurenine formamidase
MELVGNTGTYVDAPFHRFADGADLAALPLERLVDLPGRLIRVDPSEGPAIGAAPFAAQDLRGKTVLVATGWSRHWGTDAYGKDHPHLTGEAARALVGAGAALVGIDSLNIDGTAGGERPVHTALLRAGIPVVEHLTGLEELPESGFRFFAAPPRIRGMGSFPVRAFAIVEAP